MPAEFLLICHVFTTKEGAFKPSSWLAYAMQEDRLHLGNQAVNNNCPVYEHRFASFLYEIPTVVQVHLDALQQLPVSCSWLKCTANAATTLEIKSTFLTVTFLCSL